MNKLILTGRLTADPELRQTQSGIASCRFTVAVNRKHKNEDGSYDADFISCTAWRQTAEFVSRYFNKGSMIAVEGELRNNNYTDKDGVTHYGFVVNINSVEFCGSKSGSAGNATQTTQPQQTTPQTKVEDIAYGDLSEFEEILGDDEVPF